jgi:hypothetical protein
LSLAARDLDSIHELHDKKKEEEEEEEEEVIKRNSKNLS